VLFVVLAEVLILVPSVARFRQDYLSASLERAQIASLALEAEDRISSDLEAELLETAEIYNVVLRRNEVRQLVLSSPIPAPVVSSFDLRHPSVMTWWLTVWPPCSIPVIKSFACWEILYAGPGF